MKKFLLPILLLFITSTSAAGIQLPIEILDHLDDTEVYIQTVDQGNLVYDNFGHTLVRISDNRNNKDYIFNWGVFSFGQPLAFALNFYKGYLNYTLGISRYSSTLRMFAYERRTVYEDKLRLNKEQKKSFIRKILWNQRFENRNYLYQYFDDNCSTRPRDYINIALDDDFKRQFEDQSGDKTYREIIRDAYSSIPPMSMILDTILNSEIDVGMSRWQEAFLPASFRKILLTASNGEEPLVSTSRELMTFESRQKYNSTGYEIFLLLFAILILSEILFMNFEIYRPFRRLCSGLPLLFWGLWAGILGLAFPITWVVSDHEILKHNALMLLYLPLDFYFVAVGVSMIFRNKICFTNFFAKYMTLHVFLYAFLLVGSVTSLIDQDVSRSLYFICPGFIVSLYLLLINRRKSGS